MADNFVSTNETTLTIARETEPSQTDLSTAKMIRYTSENLAHSIEKVESQEILDTRGIADLLVVSESSNGGFTAELSFKTFDDLLEAFLCSSFEDNGDGTFTLNDARDYQTFTIERKIGDNYRQYYGMTPTTASFDLSTGSIITVTFNFLGARVEQTTVSIFDGEEVEDRTTNTPMTTSSNVGEVDGLVKVTNFTFEINNNGEERRVLGSRFADSVRQGQFNVTGNASMYFIDASLYERYKNNSDFTFSISLDENENEGYQFIYHRTKIQTQSDASNAKNTDVMNDITFTALSSESGIFSIIKTEEVTP